MKRFFETNGVAKVILILGGLLIVLVIFRAGVFVGYRQGAFFAYRSAGMSRDFRDPRSFFAPFMHDADEANPHGAAGEIISVKLPTILIKGPNGLEQMIVLGTTTLIRSDQSTASTSELTAGRLVVVIGEPGDDGRLNATFVRIMPVPGGAYGPSPRATSTGTMMR